MGFVHRSPLYGSLKIDPHNAICLIVEPVVTQLVEHKQANEQAGCQTKRQPNDINGRERFIADQVPPGNFEVVSEHEYFGLFTP